MKRVLIAKHPQDETWLHFPYFYAAAVKGLSEFAAVDLAVTKDVTKPLSENFELAPYDGIISFGGRFTEACLARAKNLKVVSGFGCNEAVLATKGIPFVALDGGWQRSVAEHGLGLTLACLRRIGMWHHRMATGTEYWPAQQFSENPNFVNGELYGKKVGIFGFGRIGQYYGRLCRAFSAEVAAYDNQLPDEVYGREKTKKMGLDELIAWSEIFAICSSPTPDSKGLITRERIGKLRRGAILAIISRSWALDMDAVRDRVRKSEIAVGSDVYDVEPLPPDDVLRASPNTTLTPHIAGRCADSNRMMAEIAVDGFRKALK